MNSEELQKIINTISQNIGNIENVDRIIQGKKANDGNYNSLKSDKKKLEDKLRRASGKKHSKSLPEIQRKLEEVNVKLIEKEKEFKARKEKIEKESRKKIIDLSAKLFNQDINTLNSDYFKHLSKEFIKKYHPDNNENSKINIGQFQAISKFIEENIIFKNNQITRNSVPQKDQVPSILSNIINSNYSPDDRVYYSTQVNKYIREMLENNKVTNKNLAQFLHNEFDSIINNNVNKNQQKAVFDAIYTHALSNLKSKSMDNVTPSITNQKNNEIIPESERPRFRNTYETDEEYQKYLKEFYSMRDFWQNVDLKDKNDTKKMKSILEDKFKIPQNDYPRLAKPEDKVNDNTNQNSIPRLPQHDYPRLPKPEDKVNDNTNQNNIPRLPQNNIPRLPQNEQKSPQKTNDLTYSQIINFVRYGKYDVEGITDEYIEKNHAEKGDNRKYKASNIKVRKNFKARINYSNWAYKLVSIPGAAVRAVYDGVQKFLGKIGYGKKTKARIEAMKKRANELTDEQVETLLKDEQFGSSYGVGEKKSDHNEDIIDTLLSERVGKYKMDKAKGMQLQMDEIMTDLIDIKKVVDENKKIQKDKKVLKKQVDGNMREVALTDEELKQYDEKAKLKLTGSADKIRKLQKLWNEGKALYSEGFDRDSQAHMSKMNAVGYRFSKKHDGTMDEKVALDFAQATFDNIIKNSNNDLEVFNAFFEREKLFYDNTKIENGFLGKRDTGTRQAEDRYTIKQYNYEPDPFIKNLLQTAAITSTIIHTVDSITTSIKNESTRVSHNNDLNKTNQANTNAQQQIDTHSNNILNQQNNLMKGAKDTTSMQSGFLGELAHSKAERAERLAGTPYGNLDIQAHNWEKSLMQQSHEHIQTIAENIKNGSMNHAEAFHELASFNKGLSNQLATTCQEYINIMRKYSDHSNWNYDGVNSIINKFQNGTSFEKMFDSVGKCLTEAEAVSKIKIEMAKELKGLDNDVASAITSSAMMLGYVAYRNGQVVKNNQVYSSGATSALNNYFQEQEQKKQKAKEQEEQKKEKQTNKRNSENKAKKKKSKKSKPTNEGLTEEEKDILIKYGLTEEQILLGEQKDLEFMKKYAKIIKSQFYEDSKNSNKGHHR